MNITNCLLIFLFMSSCKNDIRQMVVHKIISNIEEKVKVQNVTVVGLGEGINHENGKQKYLEITFEVDELHNIDEGRKLFLNLLSETYLEINANKSGDLVFDKYPVSINFPSIVLFSKNDLKGLSSITKYDNQDKIIYSKRNTDVEPFQSNVIHEESIDEAKNILNDCN